MMLIGFSDFDEYCKSVLRITQIIQLCSLFSLFGTYWNYQWAKYTIEEDRKKGNVMGDHINNKRYTVSKATLVCFGLIYIFIIIDSRFVAILSASVGSS